MPEPLDERRLGELLLISGKLSQEALLACMQTQQQLGGPKRKQLSEILVERGLVSPNELAALTGDQGSLALWCPSCAVTMSAPGAAPGTRFACQQCGSELQPAAGAANPTVMESSAATPPPDANPHDVDDDVRRAMADPRQRIGRYVKLEELGRGGMGVVYRCYDPQLRREVAIKEISTQSTAGSQALARFKREAQACAKLRHPGIVAVYEAGEHGGNHYLVMDLVKGRLLQDEIGTSSLSPRDLARVMRDLALALDHAHSAGIIHRDVKPENIIIDEKNQPLLMDFGLAKDLTAAKHLTQAGHVMGTPLYMAPEQVSEGELGPWTDIHALGAVLYHMLVGRSPYDGSDTPSVFRSILLEEPKPPRQLDPTINADLETITLKCLEKQPDCRYPSGAAVAAELQHFLDGQAILARPIGRRESAMRWARRNRTLTAALASAVAAVVLVVIGAAIILMRQAESARQEQRQQQRESDRKAARSEERATLVAKYTAIDKERERAREEALAQLRIEVEAVLDRVRSGEALEDPNVRRIERAKLLGHRDPAAVALLSHELDQLSEHLDDTQSLDHGQELYLHLLCDTLADLGVREAAVESIGRYLSTERALPDEHRNQLRAVAAGKALCLLGGEEAERFLLEAREGLGINGPFWTQVKPLYSYTGVVPDLEAQTTAAYMKRGMLRKEKGDLNGAIADYTRAIEADPNYSGALINRGIALKDLGDLEGAIRDYSRAIEIDPDNGMAWNNRGVARLNGGDVAGAISDYTQAIEAAPDYAPAWYHRGNARMLQGDLQRAIDDTTRAVEIDPSNAACWFNRGVALSSNGDIDAAIDDYASAIERDPGLIAAWINRSNLRFTKRDFDGAITDATRAIELDPKHAVGWGNRGNARQGKGDLEGAVADYTRAIEINPNFAMALSNRGSIRSDRGDLDDAIADTSRAIQSNPNYANAWGVRGNARYGKGDIDGAIADATRAIDLNANLVEAWGVRGLARRARGDLDGAIADWEQFLRLAPRNPKAPVVRREVKKLRQQRAKASAGGGQ